MKLPSFTLFVVNPGIGKSTLLNAVVGKVVFESGVSCGEGKTKVSKVHQVSDQAFYCDTPGLGDINLKEKASAKVRQSLLQEAGEYKLVFVVTIESGRIRLSDINAIKLVLDSFPKPKVPYGIIVNKVSRNVVELLSTDSDYKSSFVQLLSSLGGEYSVPEILFYPKVSSLEDENDVLHSPKQHLVCFLNGMETFVVKPTEVDDPYAEASKKVKEDFEIERKKQEQASRAKKAKAGTGIIPIFVTAGVAFLIWDGVSVRTGNPFMAATMVLIIFL